MNEEYLWDKTGEPDPEVQQLEEVLATLRYQPKRLELPDDAQPVRRRRHLPLLAIAATLLIALLVGGLWLRVRNKPKLEVESAETTTPASSNPVHTTTPEIYEEETLTKNPVNPNRERGVLVRHTNRTKQSYVSKLSKHDREEAVEAKEQLMIALRLASEKLNLAQRKAQGPPANQIRNQHKVG